LSVNPTKSKVAKLNQCRFLGLTFQGKKIVWLVLRSEATSQSSNGAKRSGNQGRRCRKRVRELLKLGVSPSRQTF
jgi:hypothetical protein